MTRLTTKHVDTTRLQVFTFPGNLKDFFFQYTGPVGVARILKTYVFTRKFTFLHDAEGRKSKFTQDPRRRSKTLKDATLTPCVVLYNQTLAVLAKIYSCLVLNNTLATTGAESLFY